MSISLKKDDGLDSKGLFSQNQSIISCVKWHLDSYTEDVNLILFPLYSDLGLVPISPPLESFFLHLDSSLDHILTPWSYLTVMAGVGVAHKLHRI